MIGLNASLVGSNSVRQRFERMPDEIHDALKNRLETARARLEAAVLAASPVKSEMLESGLEDKQGRIRAWISYAGSANFAKIAALEYGSKGESIKIKAATRKRSVVYGRYVAPFQLSVRAYSRTPTLVAERFLRGPFADIAAQVIDDLKAAAKQAAEKA